MDNTTALLTPRGTRAMTPPKTDGACLGAFLNRIPPWITANRLTISRIALTPPLLALTWLGYADWALPLYLVIALTDTLDGALARFRGETSKFGATLDQVSDKLLQVPMLLIAATPVISISFLAPLVAMECFLVLLRPVQNRILKKRGVAAPHEVPKHFHRPGQIKMWTEGFAVFFLLAYRQTGTETLLSLSIFAIAFATVCAMTSIVAHTLFTFTARSAGPP